MDPIIHSYDGLIDNFVRWAQPRRDLRAAIVIGSRARSERPADEWSDLDLILVTADPQLYLDRTDWIEQIGQPWLTFLEGTATGGDMERRVLFAGGLDVDFAVVPSREARALVWFLQVRRRFPGLLRLFPGLARRMEASSAGLLDILRRGIRPLIDKDGLAASLERFSTEARPPRPPETAEFLEVVNDFWYHAVWTAKHLRRGELWWAKSGCDDRMKYLLRRMLEWHARAVNGQGYDTWMRGRFLEKWADPRAVKALAAAYAHYDEQDIWRALQASMDLFRWLSVETAEKLKFPYPLSGADHATELVKSLFSGRG